MNFYCNLEKELVSPPRPSQQPLLETTWLYENYGKLLGLLFIALERVPFGISIFEG